MKNHRILVIEDEKALREAVNIILGFNDLVALTAADGKEAMNILANEHVDLILCDISLPDISGHKILKHVRGSKDLFRIPFFFLTAIADSVDVRKGMNNGADDYIIKPFASKDLVHTIKCRLSRIEKDRQLEKEYFKEKWMNIHSDFRNKFMLPFSGILQSAYLAETINDDISNKDVRDKLEAIYATGVRSFRDTRNLMMYSLFVTGKFFETKSTSSGDKLSDRLHDIIGFFNAGLANSDNTIRTQIDTIDRFEGSEEKMEIIFTELIDNAIKFDSNGLLPRVQLLKTAGGFAFSVTNTVPGDFNLDIDEVQPYKKFPSVVHTTGSGLGLFLCKSLCLRHGYQITSEKFGTDLTISVTGS